ncbi:MAG: ABC transporter ATP-binding protein/permease [Clostridia bacterium]|nr:ABC transporter ATP-binding protein/permease [Clostridia bacterium]
MMINKRLISQVSESKKYVAGNVIFQWAGLASNITMMASITKLLSDVFENNVTKENVTTALIATVTALVVRFICAIGSSKMSYLSSKSVKLKLRELIYSKLLRIGASYNEKVQTSEVIQVAVEGVDQLETYFGAYLPQFFYAMLAPLTLFAVMSFISLPCAVVLLICVPLIPVTIVAIQRWAKKLLSKYWSQYTALGDTFLENLQGLTTLKIYSADEYKNEQMNEQAEKFRKITMKVLTMQLNSITIMDLIAYAGAALGIIISVAQFRHGNISLWGCLLIILLSADFFIPMRQLGSFFHIAMNGMAASDKIFRLIDLEENETPSEKVSFISKDIKLNNLTFSYTEDREILHGISMSFPEKSFTAIVGESGCGKSTIASILMGRNKKYGGSVTLGNTELTDIPEEILMKNITYIGHNSYLFKGTVRDNLLMGKPSANDDELWDALEKVKLSDFIRNENGLDTELKEKGSNLSGGQCQRLALARAILHDSPIYIFDEATSNIDVESENDIMELIHTLAKNKTVILISHRLANVKNADNIYVLDKGNITESGTHDELSEKQSYYYKLWTAQQKLENYTGKEKA